ncbi:large membrane associated protein, partial [Cryobacterium sp. PH31-AA6]|nr:large membrane associated protein [Cryobacterium sp. PH31-AA6]
PTPTAAPEPTAPQPVGVHQWDTLFGGECLQPYASPWEQEFTVADCAAPHAAQLVYRGTFPGDAAAEFPGEEALASQINLLCSATGVIDLTAAGEYPDVQVQGSYPITGEQWAASPHYYYCFVNRSTGEPLTASVAGPGPAPAG